MSYIASHHHTSSIGIMKMSLSVMHEKTAIGYNAIAQEYAARLSRELDGKPFDREFLITFEHNTRPGTILDLGCGPGHIARYISELGRSTMGIDLSPGMVAVAKELNPGLDFMAGDMCAIPSPDSHFSGIVAFYSIIHLEPNELLLAAQEMYRVLVKNGTVALAFHGGDEVRHVESLWGISASLDFRFLQPQFVADIFREAGFTILETLTRPPYAPEVESQTTRHYIVAMRNDT